MDHPDAPQLTMEEAIAPPRKNGELIFDAPWESRAFGMAMVLHQTSAYTWPEFSSRLAAEISAQAEDAQAERALPVPSGTLWVSGANYYERWLSSLEKLLVEKGILSTDELEARTAEFAAGDHSH
jgi:nitrile hydratase accessory protein